MEELKYVVFLLGGQRYGMSLLHINGIEQRCSVIPVPNAPEGIKGIMSLRGSVVPVYSLRERFGMDSQIDHPEKSFLVTRSFGTLLAYEVDAVLSIVEVGRERTHDMPLVASNEETVFMDQVLQVEKDIIIVINVDKILSEDMQYMINQMIQENE